MKKKWISMATMISAIIGFILMNIGFWAANADKDPTYRKRILPNYDSFVLSARSLQTGGKVTSSDHLFWIYDALLKSQDTSLQKEILKEVSKLDCNGGSIMSTGEVHGQCIFDLTLENGEARQVRVEDLQEKIDHWLLERPAYLIEKLTFNFGVGLQLISGVTWLLNSDLPVLRKNKKSKKKKGIQ